jgi:hypothetical protein
MATVFLVPTASFFASTVTTSIISAGIVVLMFFFGWICYAIAKAAGVTAWPFFILGFFTSIVGVIITTILYYVGRHRDKTLRAAQRDAAGPIPLENQWTAEDGLMSTPHPHVEPQPAQPSPRQQAAPQVTQQPAAAPPVPDAPPAGATAACPNCQAQVPAGATPCPNCGTPLQWPGNVPPPAQWQ